MPSKRKKNTRGNFNNTRKNIKNKSLRISRRNKSGGMRRALTPIIRHARTIGKELAKDRLENLVNDTLEQYKSPQKTPYSTHKLSQILSNESEHNLIRSARNSRTPLGKRSRKIRNIPPTPKQFIPSPNNKENEFDDFEYMTSPNKRFVPSPQINENELYDFDYFQSPNKRHINKYNDINYMMDDEEINNTIRSLKF